MRLIPILASFAMTACSQAPQSSDPLSPGTAYEKARPILDRAELIHAGGRDGHQSVTYRVDHKIVVLEDGVIVSTSPEI